MSRKKGRPKRSSVRSQRGEYTKRNLLTSRSRKWHNKRDIKSVSYKIKKEVQVRNRRNLRLRYIRLDNRKVRRKYRKRGVFGTSMHYIDDAYRQYKKEVCRKRRLRRMILFQRKSVGKGVAVKRFRRMLMHSKVKC